MTSDKQLEANKNNALGSTGPKTIEGKETVSKNSLKHGILSSCVVINTRDVKEKESQLDEIKQRLITDMEPWGIIEEMLIDRIASTYWRLRRVIIAECGFIQKRTDDFSFKEEIKRIQKTEEYKQYSSLTPLSQKVLNSTFTEYANIMLTDIKKTVEDIGYMPKVVFENYQNIVGLLSDRESFSWMLYFNESAQGKVENEDKEKGKKALLFCLDKDIERVTMAQGLAKDLEDREDTANWLSVHIPSAEEIDKLTRYETTLENQLYKAINQLIKMQTLRKGGKVVSIQSANMESIEFENGFVSQNDR